MSLGQCSRVPEWTVVLPWLLAGCATGSSSADLFLTTTVSYRVDGVQVGPQGGSGSWVLDDFQLQSSPLVLRIIPSHVMLR
jgi:hypothetical protein